MTISLTDPDGLSAFCILPYTFYLQVAFGGFALPPPSDSAFCLALSGVEIRLGQRQEMKTHWSAARSLRTSPKSQARE
jgi:hypothetical protein